MHRPPAVSIRVGRSRWHAMVLVSAVLLAVIGLCALAWNAGSEFPQWAVWGQSILVLVTATCAVGAWLGAPIGVLQWDGEHWLWTGSEETSVSSLRLVFDLQRWVLVSVQSAGSTPLFLWLEQTHEAPAQTWLALRRALVHSTLPGAGALSSPSGPEGLLP